MTDSDETYYSANCIKFNRKNSRSKKRIKKQRPFVKDKESIQINKKIERKSRGKSRKMIKNQNTNEKVTSFSDSYNFNLIDYSRIGIPSYDFKDDISSSSFSHQNIPDSQAELNTLIKLLHAYLNAESSRNREPYFENRMRNDNFKKIQNFFSSDDFWFELQENVFLRKREDFEKIKVKFKSLTIWIHNFPLELNGEVVSDKIDQIIESSWYISSENYRKRIESFYDVISSRLRLYYKYLSYWPSSRKAFFDLDEDKYFTDQLFTNINAMQVWLNCYECFSNKIYEICTVAEIDNEFLRSIHIKHIYDFHQASNDVEFNDSFLNGKSQEIAGIRSPATEAKVIDNMYKGYMCSYAKDKKYIQLIKRQRSRSLGLDCKLEEEFLFLDNDGGDNIKYNPKKINADFDENFSKYSDIFDRRYGLKKLCNTSIEKVRFLRDKYQILFSVTKKEKSPPLFHSYAEVVKKHQPRENNEHVIFSESKEHISDESSTYLTSKDVDEEFPGIYMDVSSQLENKSFRSCSTGGDYSPDVEDDKICRNDYIEETVKGIFGINNILVEKLKFPPLLSHYLFLAVWPVKIMHFCLQKILKQTINKSENSEKLGSITIIERINYFKDALRFTLEARKFLYDVTFGINFQFNEFVKPLHKDFAPKQDIEHSDFIRISMKEVDADLSTLLKLYIDHLKQLLCLKTKSGISDPRQMLEEEWKFVKNYCHTIKQEEEIVASSFCQLIEHLFDLLKSEIENELQLDLEEIQSEQNKDMNSNVEDDVASEYSYRMNMSKFCQDYNTKCKNLKTRLKQATEFAKLLIIDLEISVPMVLHSHVTLNMFLNYLKDTFHLLVELRSQDDQCAGQSKLNLIIPQASFSRRNEYVHQLVIGFLHQTEEELWSSYSTGNTCCSEVGGYKENNDYILVININSKFEWKGEKVDYPFQWDINNLKQRLESSSILFIGRQPNNLTDQLGKFLSIKIATNSEQPDMRFFDVVLPASCTATGIKNEDKFCSLYDFQPEACHNNTKNYLNALKIKVMEVAESLLNSGTNAFSANTKSSLNLCKSQEETIRNSLKNLYSISFDFYVDMISICTGNSFKNILKRNLIKLSDKWFSFSKTFDPSANNTLPRWAYDSLQYFIHVCSSRVVKNSMSPKECRDFSENINKFIKFCINQDEELNNAPIANTNSNNKIYEKSILRNERVLQNNVYNWSESTISVTEKVLSWEMNHDEDITELCHSEPNLNRYSPLCIEKPYEVNHKDSVKTNRELSFIKTIDDRDRLDNGKGLFDSNKRDSNEIYFSNMTTFGSSAAEGDNRKHRLRLRMSDALAKLDERIENYKRDKKLIGCLKSNDSSKPYLIKKVNFRWIRKKCIGSGSTSKVYQVCDIDHNKIMAMKEQVMEEPLISEEKSEYLEECDVLCSLRHESLLEFCGVDISLSHKRIFTEYCDSGTIADLAVLEIDEQMLRKWTRQILSGLMFMHDKKIVHRDVKPENIFLINVERDTCCAKLGDFGLAAQVKDVNKGLYDIKGTVKYMAPEIPRVNSKENINGFGYNHKVDIWAMGCLVLYMMTGKLPWSENDFAVYYKLGMGTEIPHVPEVGDEETRMTNEARDFIYRCLIINSNDRPDALDLLSENFVCLSEGLNQ